MSHVHRIEVDYFASPEDCEDCLAREAEVERLQRVVNETAKPRAYCCRYLCIHEMARRELARQALEDAPKEET